MKIALAATTTLLVSAAVATARELEHQNIFAPAASSDSEVTAATPSVQDYDLSFRYDDGSNSTVRDGTPQDICSQDLELLLAQEDLRRELQQINLHYLQNAGLDRACSQTRDATNRDCHLDFAIFASDLPGVCELYGGVYVEREHSIQCHSSQQQLYYQFDRFPNCFPSSCQHDEVNDMVAKQIEAVRRAMEDDSGMTCYADNDILRHAGEDEPFQDSSSNRRNGSMLVSLWVGLMLLYSVV
jgi:hypothetical protein